LFSPPGGQLGAAGPAESPRVSASLASHPALRGVRLDAIRIGRALRFAVEAGDQVLIRSGADALAVARETPDRRLRPFGIDAVSRNDVPLPRRLGEPLRAAAGQAVLGPDGEPVSPTELAAIRRQGLYHVGERAVAFSGAEHAEALGAGATGGRFRTTDPLPPLALLVAIALLALIVLEWALLHRGRLQ